MESEDVEESYGFNLKIFPDEIMSFDWENITFGIDDGEDEEKEEMEEVEVEVEQREEVEDEQTHSTGDFSDMDSLSKPCIGMEFDNIESSQTYWKQYAYSMGFGDRIRSTNKNKDGVIKNRMYVCSREGKKTEDKRRIPSQHRAETRCGCGVSMCVSLVSQTGKYRIVSFKEDHNHELEGNRSTHRLRAHRHINVVQSRAIALAAGAGLGPKLTHRIMSLEAGGSENVGFTREDIKSHLRTKCMKEIELGEASVILEYFREQCKHSPSFFHDFQLDCEGQITNIFWADAKMLVDYHVFGDVLMFDTTFGTNKESRPLGIFTGFNNHRQTVVFGGALLFDETIPSFAWLFDTFLRCHGEKKPGVIFTDQDAAMKNALEVTMPSVRHALCTWHISQNAIKNLARVVRSRIRSFMSDFHHCMYGYSDIDEFEQNWNILREKYDLLENKWLSGLYEKKQQWSSAYLHNIFTAGARSTQLSESANARLKKELGCGVRMRKFFIGFDAFLNNVREKELQSDYECRQTLPYLPVKNSTILKHAAQIYTPNMFQLFHLQFDLEHDVCLDKNEYIEGPHIRIAKEGDRTYMINFDQSSMTISCGCCLFEMRGYLCAHILRVFNMCQVRNIPDKYILKRWTKQAKSTHDILDSLPPKLTDAQQIEVLCSEFMKLVYRTPGNPNNFNIVRELISACHAQIDQNECSNPIVTEGSINPIHTGVSGLKKKDNSKGGRKRRNLSCIETWKGRKNKKDKQNTVGECDDVLHLTL